MHSVDMPIMALKMMCEFSNHEAAAPNVLGVIGDQNFIYFFLFLFRSLYSPGCSKLSESIFIQEKQHIQILLENLFGVRYYIHNG